MPPSESPANRPAWRQAVRSAARFVALRGAIPGGTLTIVLAGVVGLLGGFGAVLFTEIIDAVTHWTYGGANELVVRSPWWRLGILVSPAIGLLAVCWLTRRFAPEAQGHGVPEVIAAVARNDGVIRPKVAIVKIIASGLTIGTGGSVGREGPIVQIGSALGSTLGQYFRLSARNMKVLVAAGAAAGISATFNAPLAGVIFASEIILGSFAVESLTSIVLASVIADIVQQHYGEHRFHTAFGQLESFDFAGAWGQLPSYLVLGLVAGLAAVGFTKLVYGAEDAAHRWLPHWPTRAVVLGLVVGVAGMAYPVWPPDLSQELMAKQAAGERPLPAVMGVGYGVVDHALHLESEAVAEAADDEAEPADLPELGEEIALSFHRFARRLQGEEPLSKQVLLPRDRLLDELLWFLPLALLKPLLTSLTLAGGGSGGIFAPSLYLGATLGASFGLVLNLAFPESSHAAGMYAIVGMGAVVAGTTHGVLSAILIVYEMTGRYEVILPIMAAAGLSSLVARMIDPESIYYKKLSRRGERIARGHDLHNLDHIMVRDVMIRHFPTLKPQDNALEIIRIARENPDIESLPVMHAGRLLGIIRAEDLHRVLDSDIAPVLVNAEDIALKTPLSVHPAQNLIEAMRDFGARDVETLPVEVGKGDNRRLVGLLLRADVIRRYRQEMLTAR